MKVPQVVARAAGYGIRGVTCDGFDPVTVYRTVKDAREYAAGGNGPVLVEMMCYRFLSHTTDDDDRTYRTRDEVLEYRPNDPLPKFEKYLLDEHILDEDAIAALKLQVMELVNRVTDEVEAEPLPKAETVYTNVYAGAHDPWI